MTTYAELREALEDMARLEKEIEETRAPYVDSEGQAMLPTNLYIYVNRLQKELDILKNTTV